MDIVEQMRSFESDHEPDGWPAVTMGQVSALCDEVERSQRLLNGMASEVERLQSLLEQERQESLTSSCRVAALEMELDSANPIPAQQSPAVAVPEFIRCNGCVCVNKCLARNTVDNGFIEDCLIAYKSGLYFDGAEGLRNKIDQQLSAIKQKSPRITDQDAREIAKSVQSFVAILGSDYSETWLNQAGRSLIAKLNEAKHD